MHFHVDSNLARLSLYWHYHHTFDTLPVPYSVFLVKKILYDILFTVYANIVLISIMYIHGEKAIHTKLTDDRKPEAEFINVHFR